MVQAIRSLELALGTPMKTFLKCEKPCFAKLGKSVVAARYLPAGHEITLADLSIKVSI